MVVTPPSFPAQCVVDASVLVKSVLPEADSALARALLATRALDARNVPDLVFAECANVLATAFRRARVPEAIARARVADLLALSVTVHPTTPLLTTALGLAVTRNISVYEAVYVTLAGSLGVPLITADIALAQRATGDTHLLGEYAPP